MTRSTLSLAVFLFTGTVVVLIVGAVFTFTPRPYWWEHFLGIAALIIGIVGGALNVRTIRRRM